MARDLLPLIRPGLIGLFIACMLASVMSSCDAFMVAASGLLTENIYKRFVWGKSEGHYVLAGRLGALFIVVIGILCAMTMESVVKGLETFWTIAAVMGIAFWVGLFWRRATVAGAWAGTLVSFGILLFTSKIAFGKAVLWDFDVKYAQMLPEYMLLDGKLLLSWQMIFYLVAGFVTLVVVSLFTKPVDKSQLDRFYGCIRTPIGENEPETKPFTLPEGVEPSERKVLIGYGGLEIPQPSLIGVVGFLGSWVIVGALIGVVFCILRP